MEDVSSHLGFAQYSEGERARRTCHASERRLLGQRRGSITVSDTDRRDDCTEVHVPNNVKGSAGRGAEESWEFAHVMGLQESSTRAGACLVFSGLLRLVHTQ